MHNPLSAVSRRVQTTLCALLVLILTLPACNRSSSTEHRASTRTEPAPTPTPKPAPAPTPRADPAVDDIPFDPSVPADPKRQPTLAAEPADRVAVLYILVKHHGANDAEGATRDRDAAARRAARLSALARQKDQDFAVLAARYSEVPEADRGRQVIFSQGTMDPAFETAALAMDIGQVSDAVETPFGYYVIQRVIPEEYASAHILVQYAGAKNAPEGTKRTREEAKKRAELVLDLANKGQNFAVLAERFSDSPSRLRGGVIVPMVPGQMPKEYDAYIEALKVLEVDAVSPVVETPFGFHVIKRLKLERISASHILIAWTGSEGTPREERTRGDAERLARKILLEAKAEEADFAELAKKYSDDSSTAEKGGDLGSFARGMMHPRLEQMAFALKVGEVSDLVLTQYGFHVVLRTR